MCNSDEDRNEPFQMFMYTYFDATIFFQEEFLLNLEICIFSFMQVFIVSMKNNNEMIYVTYWTRRFVMKLESVLVIIFHTNYENLHKWEYANF